MWSAVHGLCCAAMQLHALLRSQRHCSGYTDGVGPVFFRGLHNVCGVQTGQPAGSSWQAQLGKLQAVA